MRMEDDKWDDSELLDDWNQAYNEYKKYHSMAARGEKASVDDIPSSHRGPIESMDKSKGVTIDLPVQQASTPVSAFAQSTHAPLNYTTAANSNGDVQSSHAQLPTASAPVADPARMPDLARTMLGGVDGDLKNIMMSWYYAGYYTGLYDGQQKAYASMHNATAAAAAAAAAATTETAADGTNVYTATPSTARHQDG